MGKIPINTYGAVNDDPLNPMFNDNVQLEFWVVWCPDGHAPVKKHPSESSAWSEASRLAQKDPGHQFFVLHASEYAVAEIPQVQRKRMHRLTPDDIPF